MGFSSSVKTLILSESAAQMAGYPEHKHTNRINHIGDTYKNTTPNAPVVRNEEIEKQLAELSKHVEQACEEPEFAACQRCKCCGDIEVRFCFDHDMLNF